MKSFFTLIVLFLLASGFSSIHAQTLPYLPEPTFKSGEKIKYRLKMLGMSIATAEAAVRDSEFKFGTDPTFHLSANGATSGLLSLYKVQNKYDSYINSKTFLPYLYIENIRENSYRREEYATFDHRNRKVSAKKGEFKSPTAQTFDLVSAYYFARNLDFSSLKKGDKFKLSYFLSDEVGQFGVEYIGIEKVKTALGEVECIKLNPEISPGRIFKKDSKLYLWVTNDGNRIPVKAHVELVVGSITLEIVSAEGLKHQFGKRVSYSK